MNDNARRLNALIRLGIARQAPPDEATQQVYLEELGTFGADVVEIACQQLTRRARADYEPAFPTVGTVLEECRSLVRRQSLETNTSRLLTSKPDDEPLTRDEAKAWVDRLRAAVERKRELVDGRRGREGR